MNKKSYKEYRPYWKTVGKPVIAADNIVDILYETQTNDDTHYVLVYRGAEYVYAKAELIQRIVVAFSHLKINSDNEPIYDPNSPIEQQAIDLVHSIYYSKKYEEMTHEEYDNFSYNTDYELLKDIPDEYTPDIARIIVNTITL